MVDRMTQVNTVDAEVVKGYLPPKEAIKELYPNLTVPQLIEREAHYIKVNSLVLVDEEPEIEDDDETTEV
jgi:hypothetical protein